MVGHLILLVLALTSLCGGAFDPNLVLSPARSPYEHRQKPRCRQERARGVMGADCIRLELTEIPQILQKDIEGLEMTYNRIRELYNTSFVRYSSLRYLYLGDNMISHIEPGAFDPLSDLEVLDLSYNSLHAIPDALQNLVSLRKLALDFNPFLPPVNFPSTLYTVQALSLSRGKLKRLPNMSAVPGVTFLNVSQNRLQSIDVFEVAPMCRLKDLDLTGNPQLFLKEYCKCHVFAKWISMRGIVVSPNVTALCKNAKEGFNYVSNPSICFTNETNLLLEESERIARSCETEVQRYGSGPIRISTSVMWVLIVAGFCCFALVFFFGLYCMRKKQKLTETDHSSESLTRETHS